MRIIKVQGNEASFESSFPINVKSLDGDFTKTYLLHLIQEEIESLKIFRSPEIKIKHMKHIKELKRRLLRLENLRDELLHQHQGKELKYTYWGGHELGYLKGKISEIEKAIDYYNEQKHIKS